MTFSEYISAYAQQQYLNWCKQHNQQPVFDTQLPAPKVCALLKPQPKPANA
jgi:hypothetical protein